MPVIDDWLKTYRIRGAVFERAANAPAHVPHVALTAQPPQEARHSADYFNSAIITKDGAVLRTAVQALVDQLALRTDLVLVDCVVGAQKGATKLATFIAATISNRRGSVCRFASPHKDDSTGVRRMVFDNPLRDIHPNETILLCEDTVSTGDTLQREAEACEELGATTLPFVPVLLNRSGKTHIDGREIIALAEWNNTRTWPASACQLCDAGSPVVGDVKNNWDKLMGR